MCSLPVFLTLEAWVELLRAAVLVRTPLGRPALIKRALDGQIGESDEPGTAAVLAAIARASRFHIKTFYCLERSLALLWMLRRRRIGALLQIGCRQRGEALDFHSWVVDLHSRPIGATGEESTYLSLTAWEKMGTGSGKPRKNSENMPGRPVTHLSQALRPL
jgi:hypothetical protein